MRSRILAGLILSVWLGVPGEAADFGLAENVLSQFRAIRYENIYTKVPTTGKLVSIKITDSGKTYYICREDSGYVIYNLEIRPIAGFKEKMESELKEESRQWNSVHPDELFLTRERHLVDLKRRLNKYCEAVWVRNEIVVSKSLKPSGTKR